jgi:long-chain acyl-CoA synthetase
MVAGEAKPYLVALVVLNAEGWDHLARALAVDGADPESLEAEAVTKAIRARIGALLRGFPAYAQVRGVWLTLEPWTIEDRLITPTLKLRRPELERRFADPIHKLYARHHLPE